MRKPGVHVQPRRHVALLPQDTLIDQTVIPRRIQAAHLKIHGRQTHVAVPDRPRPLVVRVVLVETHIELAGQVRLERVPQKSNHCIVQERRIPVLRRAEISIPVLFRHVLIRDVGAGEEEVAGQFGMEVVVARQMGQGRREVGAGRRPPNQKPDAGIRAAWEYGRICLARLSGDELQRLPGVADGEGEWEMGRQAIRRADDDGGVRLGESSGEREFEFGVARAVAAAVEQEDQRARRRRVRDRRRQVAQDDAGWEVVTEFDKVGGLGDVGGSRVRERLLDT